MVYTTKLVERLLRQYLSIITTLDTRSQQLPTVYIEKRDFTRDPFAPTHAKAPVDGKARARFLEELHVSVIDIEQAFPFLTQDDQELIVRYHIWQTDTLDELAKERGVTSRGSMQRRIYRSVEWFTRILNSKHLA